MTLFEIRDGRSDDEFSDTRDATRVAGAQRTLDQRDRPELQRTIAPSKLVKEQALRSLTRFELVMTDGNLGRFPDVVVAGILDRDDPRKAQIRRERDQSLSRRSKRRCRLQERSIRFGMTHGSSSRSHL